MICVEIFLQNESKTVIKLSDILWSNLRKKILRVDVVFGCTVSERVRARWAHCACALSTRSRQDRRSVCEGAQPCWDRALGLVCFSSVPQTKSAPANGSPDKDFEFSLPVFIGRENELQYWLKAARRRSASAGLNFIFVGIRRLFNKGSNPTKYARNTVLCTS